MSKEGNLAKYLLVTSAMLKKSATKKDNGEGPETMTSVIEKLQTRGAREQTFVTPGISEKERVAAKAYELWKARGCPLGDDLRDWFAAEKLVRRSFGGFGIGGR